MGQMVKRFLKIMLLKHEHWGTLPTCVPVKIVKGHLVGSILNAQICEKQNTSLRSQIPQLNLVAKSGATPNLKISNFNQFRSRIHKIFRIAVAPYFAVKSSKGACGHSRSQTWWSQARLSFLQKMWIKNTADNVTLRISMYTCRERGIVLNWNNKMQLKSF